MGPGGVVVISTKCWNGHVEVRDGVLRQNGYARHPVIEVALGQAVAVAGSLLPRRTGAGSCAPWSAWRRSTKFPEHRLRGGSAWDRPAGGGGGSITPGAYSGVRDRTVCPARPAPHAAAGPGGVGIMARPARRHGPGRVEGAGSPASDYTASNCWIIRHCDIPGITPGCPWSERPMSSGCPSPRNPLLPGPVSRWPGAGRPALRRPERLSSAGAAPFPRHPCGAVHGRGVDCRLSLISTPSAAPLGRLGDFAPLKSPMVIDGLPVPLPGAAVLFCLGHFQRGSP